MPKGIRLAGVLGVVGVLLPSGASAAGVGPAPDRPVVRLEPRVVAPYHPVSVRASGLTARSAEVRLLGAVDPHGPAYDWTPYPWRPLRLRHGTWRGILPAPPLLGIYRVQLRVDHDRRLSSSHWLLRLFPHGTMRRRSFPTPAGAIRDYVAGLPGDEALVALKRWKPAAFDRRDRRLNRLFVIAYAPHGNDRPGSRFGVLVTTVRDGCHGRWRLLEATTEPYG